MPQSPKNTGNIIGQIALKFTIMRDTMKFYHWSTKIFARHLEADNFVDNLTLKMDRFIEVMQGLYNKRAIVPSKMFSIKKHTDTTIIKELNDFKKFLINDIPKHIRGDTDLMNIRDDMLADVNNTLYLFTFN